MNQTQTLPRDRQLVERIVAKVTDHYIDAGEGLTVDQLSTLLKVSESRIRRVLDKHYPGELSSHLVGRPSRFRSTHWVRAYFPSRQHLAALVRRERSHVREAQTKTRPFRAPLEIHHEPKGAPFVYLCFQGEQLAKVRAQGRTRTESREIAHKLIEVTK